MVSNLTAYPKLPGYLGLVIEKSLPMAIIAHFPVQQVRVAEKVGAADKRKKIT